jgi:hypothetical protein
MAISSSDISSDYTIKILSGTANRGSYKVTETIPSPGVSKKITIAASFGSINFENGDILRISDGSTTIDYDADANATSTPNTIAHTDDASTAVDQFVSKINSSALNVTAVDNGGSSSNASFTLIPNSGVTITVTQDPSGDNQFGSSSGYCVIEDVESSTTVEKQFTLFRFSSNGPMNIRQQSPNNCYRTFIGDQKS